MEEEPQKTVLVWEAELGTVSGKGEGRKALPNHISLLDALPGASHATLGSSPFMLWATLKMLHVVPGCNGHRWNQPMLRSLVSFVFRPTLVPVGG